VKKSCSKSGHPRHGDKNERIADQNAHTAASRRAEFRSDCHHPVKHGTDAEQRTKHEQLHWYLDAHRSQTEAAEAELRKLYPKVPVGYPEGAQDEESTYLHLIDCYLEMKADQRLMGMDRAAKVMNFWATLLYAV
jgi:hypothetical protein